VPVISAVLEGPADDPDALITAVRALGRIGDATAADALKTFIQRADLPADAALQDSINQGARASRDVSWQIRLATAEALKALGAPMPEIAEAYLADPRAFVRAYAERISG